MENRIQTKDKFEPQHTYRVLDAIPDQTADDPFL